MSMGVRVECEVVKKLVIDNTLKWRKITFGYVCGIEAHWFPLSPSPGRKANKLAGFDR
jgi:hypothetical protein